MKGDFIPLEVVYVHIFLIKSILNDFCDDSWWKIQFLLIMKPEIYALYSKHIYDLFITVVSSSSSKLPGLNKFSCWLAALLDVAHLETLVKQEQLQVTVHVRVHLFPSHLA